MNNLVKIVFIIFTLNACVFSDCETIDLTEEEKSYFEAYKLGQIVTFKNYQKDTAYIFKVNDVDLYYSTCSKIEIGPNVYQTLSFGMKDSNTPKTQTEFYSYFSKENKTKKCYKEFSCFDFYTDFYDERGKIKWIKFKNKPLQVLFLDKHKFKEKPNKYVKAIYWSKKHGLVRFDTFDGQYFELQ